MQVLRGPKKISPPSAKEYTWDEINSEEGVYTTVGDREVYLIAIWQGDKKAVVMFLDETCFEQADELAWENDVFVKSDKQLLIDII